jgi:hypothetical protein
VGQPVRLHHGHDQGVVAQDANLLTDPGRGIDHVGRDGEDLNAHLRDLLQRRAELG